MRCDSTLASPTTVRLSLHQLLLKALNTTSPLLLFPAKKLLLAGKAHRAPQLGRKTSRCARQQLFHLRQQRLLERQLPSSDVVDDDDDFGRPLSFLLPQRGKLLPSCASPKNARPRLQSVNLRPKLKKKKSSGCPTGCVWPTVAESLGLAKVAVGGCRCQSVESFSPSEGGNRA